MQDEPAMPEGQVADAVKGNWVDSYAPAATRPFLRLSRADRPIGTWLLLLPCWWGLALAMLHDQRASWFDLWILVACAIGAFLMRGAGYMERHHRPGHRRTGRAHSIAPDPFGTGEHT